MIKIEQIKGIDEMRRNIEGRLRRLEQSMLRKALQAFAEPIRANAEQFARTLISPRMKVISQIRMRGSSGTVRIGPSTEVFRVTASGRTVTHAMVGYWFEFGYDIRAEQKGPSLAHVGARPSLTPAYESQKERALVEFEAVMRNALEAEV